MKATVVAGLLSCINMHFLIFQNYLLGDSHADRCSSFDIGRKQRLIEVGEADADANVNFQFMELFSNTVDDYFDM